MRTNVSQWNFFPVAQYPYTHVIVSMTLKLRRGLGLLDPMSQLAPDV
jgi:hypothetical protein